MAGNTLPSNLEDDAIDEVVAAVAEGDRQTLFSTSASDADIPEAQDKAVHDKELVDLLETPKDAPVDLMNQGDLVELGSEGQPKHMKPKVENALATISGCQTGEEITDIDGAKQSTPEFAPFPRLPTELRLQIWKYALPRGRVVQLLTSLCIISHGSGDDALQAIDRLNCSVIAPEMSLLSTNAESREVAQSSFKPLVAKSCNDKTKSKSMGPNATYRGHIGVKCDFERDQFLFGARGFECLDQIKHLGLFRVRKVVLILRAVPIGSDLFKDILKYFQKQCPKLTHLTFAVGDPEWIKEESFDEKVLIRIDSNLIDLIDFRREKLINEHERRPRKVLNVYRGEIALGMEPKRHFDIFVRESAPEWKRLVVEVAFLARKAVDSSDWTIRCVNWEPTDPNYDIVKVVSKGERADRYVGIWEMFEGHTLAVGSKMAGANADTN